MATLDIDGDRLVVELSTLEKLGAVRGDVRVALSAIASVIVLPDPFEDLHGMRAPGTGWPGRIALGTWRYRGGRDFAALYGRKPAIVVELRGAHFTRLLVTTQDADSVAQRIRAALP